MHLRREMALDFIEGRLVRQLSEELMTHLDDCPPCMDRVEDCQWLLASLKRPHLQNAPSPTLDSAVSLYQAPVERARRATLRQAIASLVFDSFSQPAPAGSRSLMVARHLVMRADEYDIHLRISETGERREVFGQVQSCKSNGFIDAARLHLICDGQRVSSTHVNELGEFQFNSIPDGTLNLQIDLPQLTVIGFCDLEAHATA
jgi:hypothetical protein